MSSLSRRQLARRRPGWAVRVAARGLAVAVTVLACAVAVVLARGGL